MYPVLVRGMEDHVVEVRISGAWADNFGWVCKKHMKVNLAMGRNA